MTTRAKYRVRIRYWEPATTPTWDCELFRAALKVSLGHEPQWSHDHRDADAWACVVYEAYDREEQPLYVGLSRQLAKRMRSHFRSSGWWSEAESFVLTFFPCVDLMRHYELRQIRALKPAYNKPLTGRPRRKQRVES